MNKLTYGVGVNDLGYRIRVQEEVTENRGKKNQGVCFSIQILCSVEKHVSKML